MKLRMGFVSNSSSSSFLLLGFKRSEELEGFSYESQSGGEYYYGETLAYGLDESDFEIDPMDLPKKIKDIAEEYKVDPEEIMLYIANTEC